METKSTGTYKNLLIQLDKVAKHTRQGSFKTRERYYKAFKRFCTYLADTYRLEKLSNISPKHIASYTEFMKEKGLSPSTIKIDLTAIRFYHDQMPQTKHTLPANSTLDIARRRFGGVDRTWSQREFNLMVLKAFKCEREDYAAIFTLARYAALRLEECFKIDTASADRAIKTGEITVKGKGGLMRTVPINESIRIELQKMLTITPRGHKLFVANCDKTHLAKKRLQNFICYHRPSIQEEGSVKPMTFHGLRHTCAAEWYNDFVKAGYAPFEARKKVAEWLGHHRDDVTRIYLASTKDGDFDV